MKKQNEDLFVSILIHNMMNGNLFSKPKKRTVLNGGYDLIVLNLLNCYCSIVSVAFTNNFSARFTFNFIYIPILNHATQFSFIYIDCW